MITNAAVSRGAFIGFTFSNILTDRAFLSPAADQYQCCYTRADQKQSKSVK